MANILFGVEIGSSRISAMIGEGNPACEVAIRAFGQAPSNGVKRGAIVEPQVVAQDLEQALSEVRDQMPDRPDRVYVAFSGPHLHGYRVEGKTRLLGGRVTKENLDRIYNRVKDRRMSSRERLLHWSRLTEVVDGEECEGSPLGRAGKNLEVSAHRLTARAQELKPFYELFDRCALRISSMVFGGVAACQACIPPEKRQSAALLIDIGAGITDYVLYQNGVICASGIVKIAGDDISHAISRALGIPPGDAEAIKEEIGRQAPVNQVETEERYVGERFVPPEDFNYEVDLDRAGRVMRRQLTKLFRQINDRLRVEGLESAITGGVHLCGGGANILGVDALAAEVFNTETQIVRSRYFGWNIVRPLKPELAAISGLLTYAANSERRF